MNGSTKASVSVAERTRKCSGIPMPTAPTPTPRRDLDHDGGQQDRQAAPALDDDVEERVARVVVLDVVAGEPELVVEVGPHALERRAPSNRRPARRAWRPPTTCPVTAARPTSPARPRRAGRRRDRPAIRRGEVGEAGELLGARIHRPKRNARYVRRHVPRRLRRHPPRQARDRDGVDRCDHDVRRARRRRQPACRGCCARPACEPGDHVAFCMENHPRYLEVAWGCHYAGAIYTACSSRLTSGELSYILERLRGQGLHHVEVQGRAGRRDHRRHARRHAAADARRDDRRLRGLRAGRRRAVAGADARPDRRHRHALLVGHDRDAQGRGPRVRPRAARRQHDRCRRRAAAAVRGDARTRSTCPPPRCTTPRRCGSA